MNASYKNIPGWFSDAEANALYNLVLSNGGSVLEIGFCFGRSTSCICEAIRDCEQTRIFDSYDMDCKTKEELMVFYRQVHQNPLWEIPSTFNEYAYDKGKTMREVAVENLSWHGLLKFVALHSGDFRTISNMKYDIIFCDAIHDRHEIDLNLGDIERLSNPSCKWAFHDMKADNIAYIQQKYPMTKLEKQVEDLGIFVLPK